MESLYTKENSLINGENKVRLSFSKSALITMTEDMEVFGVSKTTTLINTIFANYWEEARASVSLYLRRKKLELDNLLANTSVEPTQKQIIIDHLVDGEKKKILADMAAYKNSSTTGKLYYISTENVRILEEIYEVEQCYSKPAAYIRAVIEEYCALPFIERERIYKKDLFQIVQKACDKRHVLKVKTTFQGQKETFIVYPYKIIPDTLHTRSYLVCYSRRESEPEKNKIVASFAMARMEKPYESKVPFYLNKEEIKYIEGKIAGHSAAYLVGKTEQIKVRLTEKGKRSYQTRLFSRPEMPEILPDGCTYVFNCTPQQIFNYFFSFGAEAEILEPVSLRERFKNTYRNAYTLYTDEKTPHD